MDKDALDTSLAEWLSLVVSQWLHDMKNRLGAARVESMEGLETGNVESFSTIRNNIERAQQLADQIYNVLRNPLLAATDRYRPQATNVMEVLSTTLGEFRSTASPDSIRVTASADVPLVNAHPALLTGIVENVIENGLRASGSSVPAVEINVSFEDEESVFIDVQDHGPGIDPAILPEILERPFLGTDPATGMGVGLFVAHRILQGWGGAMQIASSGPSGTTVRIQLIRSGNPTLVDTPSEELTGTRTGPRNQHSASEHWVGRALVVDDDSDWVRLISERMAGHGLEVHSATTSVKALDLASTNLYDIAFIDLYLGYDKERGLDEGGLAAAQAIRKSNPQALILVLTGYPSYDTTRRALRVRVDDVVHKANFSFEILETALSEAIRRREEQNASLSAGYLDSVINESLATISHELRTPLISLKRHAEALESGALGDLNSRQREAVEIILRETRREFDLFNAHVDLNSIERRVTNLQPVSYDVVELLREEVDAYAREAHRKGLTIEQRLPEQGYMASVDPTRLRIALNPLLDNAVKFSPKDGTIRVQLQRESEGLAIGISDDGPGMTPEDVHLVLGWRSNSESMPSARARSSGLGLRIARRIAELHRGNLRIDSDGQQGTTVWLWLPEN